MVSVRYMVSVKEVLTLTKNTVAILTISALGRILTLQVLTLTKNTVATKIKR